MGLKMITGHSLAWNSRQSSCGDSHVQWQVLNVTVDSWPVNPMWWVVWGLDIPYLHWCLFSSFKNDPMQSYSLPKDNNNCWLLSIWFEVINCALSISPTKRQSLIVTIKHSCSLPYYGQQYLFFFSIWFVMINCALNISLIKRTVSCHGYKTCLCFFAILWPPGLFRTFNFTNMSGNMILHQLSHVHTHSVSGWHNDRCKLSFGSDISTVL